MDESLSGKLYRKELRVYHPILEKYFLLIKNEKKVILSIGHDNPQGIIYDKVNNVIFSTEHGPQGGVS